MCPWNRMIIGLTAGVLVACGQTTSTPTTTGTATGLPMGAVEVEQPLAVEQPLGVDYDSNRAPEIQRITLRPQNPRPGEQVTANVEASDPDGDSVSLRYEWRIKGQRVGDRSSLHVTGHKKGTTIELRVTPSDGRVEGRPEFATVRIGNQPPVMLGLVLEPLGEVTVTNDIGASPRATDPDGDDLEYSYVWHINGEVADTDEGVLRKEEFKRGDQITVRVIADDGSEQSEPLESQPFRVVNAPPTITSKPGAFDDDGNFRYQLAASDPDGDRRFRFRLLESPEGMAMELLNGMITWTPTDDQAGNHPVIVEADDMAGGKATQSFSVRVAFEDSPPANTASN